MSHKSPDSKKTVGPKNVPCNDPGAWRKIVRLYLWKNVIQDLSATKNRQTRIFQFNGILFKVVYVVQNKIDAYPSWDKSITEYTNASTSYLWVAFYYASFV